jgi:hypothetical protein
MAAGNTYVALATETLTSAQASVTFSSISGAYTDLVLVINALTASSNAVGVEMTFNATGSTGRSFTRIQGNGTSESSFQNYPNDSAIGVLGDSDGGNIIAQIMNYSNSTTYKTILTRYNSLDAGDGRVGSYVSLWSSTAAITSLIVAPISINWASGSTFSLYGIAAA